MKPTPSREKPKRSPESRLRLFYERFGPKHRKLIRAVRAAVRRRFPSANELAYDYSSFILLAYSPTERGIDAFVSIAARANRVDLYFNNGPKLPDPKELLRGSGRQTRYIRLEKAAQLLHPDVKALIAAAKDLARTPLAPKGKGTLIIKTDKSGAKPKPRKKVKK